MDFKITHFTTAGGNAVFGGYINSEPAVYFITEIMIILKCCQDCSSGPQLLDIEQTRTKALMY